jgi:hypothetical protein
MESNVMLIPCNLRKINLLIQGKDNKIHLPEFCNNSGYLSIDEDGNVVAYKFEPVHSQSWQYWHQTARTTKSKIHSVS